MRRIISLMAVGAMLAASGPAGAMVVEAWRTPDPASILMIETAKGRILIELHPELAPETVARMAALSRKGFFDGQPFYRVIDGFVAQAGDPEDEDNSKSGLKNLPPEFSMKLKPGSGYVPVRTTSDGGEGFLGAMPAAIVAAAETAWRNEGTVQTWGAFCAGTVGMARDEALDSGNATFFILRNHARRLERIYTPFGVVISGLELVRALAVGEPPEKPDVMKRVRVLSDVPEAERPQLAILLTDGPDFRQEVDRMRAEKGADFTVCDLTVRVQVDGIE